MSNRCWIDWLPLKTSARTDLTSAPTLSWNSPAIKKASARQMTTIKSQSPNSGMRSETFIAVSLRQIQDIFKAMVLQVATRDRNQFKDRLEKARWASEQADPLVAEVPWLSVNCFSVGPLASTARGLLSRHAPAHCAG